jgi:hypothetical protein
MINKIENLWLRRVVIILAAIPLIMISAILGGFDGGCAAANEHVVEMIKSWRDKSAGGKAY